MRVHLTPRFKRELGRIFDFIAQDSPKQATKFERSLLLQLNILSRTARDHRKSFYVDAPNAHDFIFKGYVIPYRVNDSKNQVELLGIFKHNIWRY